MNKIIGLFLLALVSCGGTETTSTNPSSSGEISKTNIALSTLAFDFHTGANAASGGGDGQLRGASCEGAGDNAAGLYFCPNQTSLLLRLKM